MAIGMMDLTRTGIRRFATHGCMARHLGPIIGLLGGIRQSGVPAAPRLATALKCLQRVGWDNREISIRAGGHPGWPATGRPMRGTMTVAGSPGNAGEGCTHG